MPVSAPSSVMLDKIVNTATAAKKMPAPRAPTSRVTTIASRNAKAPDSTKPTRFSVPPRARRRSSGAGCCEAGAATVSAGLDTATHRVRAALDGGRTDEPAGHREREIRPPLQRTTPDASPRPPRCIAAPMQRRVRERDAPEQTRGVRVVVDELGVLVDQVADGVDHHLPSVREHRAAPADGHEGLADAADTTGGPGPQQPVVVLSVAAGDRFVDRPDPIAER